MLAATKIDFFGFVRLVFCRCEFAALMAAVAKRLLTAFATRTPKIILAFFDLDGVRGLLGDNSVTH
jgi:hypothetical protein